MKYIMTIVWAVIISFVIGYVLASMAGETLHVPSVLSLAAIFSIIVILLGDGVLKESN
ncbi:MULTISPECIES: DUF2929 family protein [Gracilibacillus]|uniref:DUF2929 domain-containing protein n=1 Tax=Gracilibacillus dipsosauri TaxID=178340 RepID=A0A317KW68_9BACI|nr:DUF2929 family protein [Gracilibacillus dipsosauri]PWU67741.1 DUF2929 domain-containing protein [Gracilibacillus dipsosauri]